MFGKPKSREVEDFATTLVQEFARRCPAGAPRDTPQRAAAMARAVDDACDKASGFRRAKGLGFLGKAKFGTAFKLQMVEQGYAEDFVDELTRRLLIAMSGR
jgi:hypothetical protein